MDYSVDQGQGDHGPDEEEFTVMTTTMVKKPIIRTAWTVQHFRDCIAFPYLQSPIIITGDHKWQLELKWDKLLPDKPQGRHIVETSVPKCQTELFPIGTYDKLCESLTNQDCLVIKLTVTSLSWTSDEQSSVPLKLSSRETTPVKAIEVLSPRSPSPSPVKKRRSVATKRPALVNIPTVATDDRSCQTSNASEAKPAIYKKMAAMETDLKSTRSQLNAKDNELTVNKKKFSKVMAANEELIQTLKTRDNDLIQMRINLDSQTIKIEQLEKSKLSFAAKFKELQSECLRLLASENDLKSKLVNSESLVSKTQELNRQSNEKITQLTATISRGKESDQKMREAHLKEITELKLSMRCLANEKQSVDHHLAEVDELRLNAINQVEQYETILSVKDKRLSELGDSVNQLRADKKQLEEEIEKLRKPKWIPIGQGRTDVNYDLLTVPTNQLTTGDVVRPDSSSSPANCNELYDTKNRLIEAQGIAALKEITIRKISTKLDSYVRSALIALSPQRPYRDQVDKSLALVRRIKNEADLN
ncbi:hypothetical protein HDE_04892 [Halotydeus destructor]|nr:hypothetical protein HDE_04892 [Halotydeus destructor]